MKKYMNPSAWRYFFIAKPPGTEKLNADTAGKMHLNNASPIIPPATVQPSDPITSIDYTVRHLCLLASWCTMYENKDHKRMQRKFRWDLILTAYRFPRGWRSSCTCSAEWKQWSSRLRLLVPATAMWHISNYTRLDLNAISWGIGNLFNYRVAIVTNQMNWNSEHTEYDMTRHKWTGILVLVRTTKLSKSIPVPVNWDVIKPLVAMIRFFCRQKYHSIVFGSISSPFTSSLPAIHLTVFPAFEASLAYVSNFFRCSRCDDVRSSSIDNGFVIIFRFDKIFDLTFKRTNRIRIGLNEQHVYYTLYIACGKSHL